MRSGGPLNTPASLFPDLLDLLQAFDDAEVKYLLVGGHAVALHGRPRFTQDADLWLNDTLENLKRVETALEAFGAPPGTAQRLSEAEPSDVVWMGFPPTRIDLLKWVPGPSFQEAWPLRETRAIAGVKVLVVGKATLLELKRASGRAKDLEDAKYLE